jgi:hypothetical protein
LLQPLLRLLLLLHRVDGDFLFPCSPGYCITQRVGGSLLVLEARIVGGDALTCKESKIKQSVHVLGRRYFRRAPVAPALIAAYILAPF